jgi:hypothetical protein
MYERFEIIANIKSMIFVITVSETYLICTERSSAFCVADMLKLCLELITLISSDTCPILPTSLVQGFFFIHGLFYDAFTETETIQRRTKSL